MKKYYFSENKTFDSSGIVVTYNGIDVTDKSDITFKETPSIYNGETFDYEISFDVNFSMETENGTIGECLCRISLYPASLSFGGVQSPEEG